MADRSNRTAGDAQLYLRVLENVDRAIVAIDGQGTITLFNPTAQTYTGFSDRQALGRSFQALFSGQQELLALVEEAQLKGRTISAPENIQIQRPMSPPLPVSVSACPLLDENGRQDGVALIIRDLSRVRELEEAVRRADRLSMLGTLAAGLAHEVKNPLGGIKGAAQLLAMELGKENPLREYTDVMVKEVERVNAIIEELMDLSRPRRPEWSEVNLTRILNDLVLFQTEAQRGRDIEFRLLLDPSIPPIRGDEHLLTRLLLNLVKNAAEAVSNHGMVEIRSRIGSELHLTRPGERPVPFVVIDVIDNGKGISEEELEQIFTPFFTSKTQGSGLGLAICQKIISEHAGFMKVTSQPGHGSTFSVSLPFLPFDRRVRKSPADPIHRSTDGHSKHSGR